MDVVTTPAGTEPAPTLPADLRLGPVHLVVPDVDRSVAWYERALGLVAHGRGADTAELGDGSEVAVVVHHDPAARPAGRHAGLYHYALLYPSREALARAATRLAATRTPIEGASDHRTHEAIYLGDVDANGIELAADRPRERWPRDLGYHHGPAPLDFNSLLATARDEDAGTTIDRGVRVGHLHLHVGDIDTAIRFYCGVLGFELQENLGTAAFVSAGGYHHHLGFNVWRGRGIGPPPPHTIGLRYWTVLLRREQDVAAIRARLDAAGIAAEAADGGFLTRDPGANAVVFRATG